MLPRGPAQGLQQNYQQEQVMLQAYSRQGACCMFSVLQQPCSSLLSQEHCPGRHNLPLLHPDRGPASLCQLGVYV
jgi:hypothetical protein